VNAYPGTGAHRQLLDLWLEEALSAFRNGMDLCAGHLVETAERVAAAADRVLCVPSVDTPRIQEVHIFLGHALCDLVERMLFPQGGS